MINLLISLLCCTVVSLSFVGLLYIWPYKVRNDPRSMCLRVVSVFISSTLSILIASYVIPTNQNPDDLFDILGLSRSKNLQLQKSLLPVLTLTAFLFAGPIDVLRYTFTREELIKEILSSMKTLEFWRDYFIAPISEEVVFRAVNISILSTSISNPFIVLILSSIFFSTAHIHHYLFQSVAKSKVSFQQAISIQIISVFFGCYSGAYFLKSNCILSSIACHIFCNAMGAPDFGLLRSNWTWWHNTIYGALIWSIAFPLYLTYY